MAYEGKKTKVFHATRPGFRTDGDLTGLLRPDYELVAEVETDDPHEAFGLTNSADDRWWFNERITAMVTPCRSTSVGDVLVLPSGTALLVVRVGFWELPTW